MKGFRLEFEYVLEFESHMHFAYTTSVPLEKGHTIQDWFNFNGEYTELTLVVKSISHSNNDTYVNLNLIAST